MYYRNRNLWLHPESGNQGGDTPSTSAPPASPPPLPSTPDAPPDYSELLKTDKDFIAFMNSNITQAVTQHQNKQKLLADEKATEAEKLSAMNDKERITYEQKKQEQEIAQLRTQIATREMKDTAIKMASEKGLPLSMLEVIDFGTLKAEDVGKTLDSFKTIFDSAVAQAVKEKLKGDGLPRGMGNSGKATPTTMADTLREHYNK